MRGAALLTAFALCALAPHPAQCLRLGEKAEAELWSADQLTALGSTPKGNLTAKPIVAIGLGFDGCITPVLTGILKRHPGVIMPDTPDNMYFSERRGGKCDKKERKRGTNDYDKYIRACFGGRFPSEVEATVDISTDYASNLVERVVRRVVPLADNATVRLLAIVCDPRERVVDTVKRRLERETSAEVTTRELSDLCENELKKHKRHPNSRRDIVGMGEFHEPLDQFLKELPRESMLVINSEALGEVETWHRIFNHIGLPIPEEKQLKKWVSSMHAQYPGHRRTIETLDPETQTQLRDFYNTSNAQLWKMLDSKEWW